MIRRVSLDLTGLPPTPAEVDAFLGDQAQDAYEKLVDRLLASPRYGEHMARYWLDVARYGDTHGLHLDNERSMWPYRDWVVDAFNRNLPFDQFTIWQLAGDLLPNATREQRVASGFNRCNVSTSEGGAIDEEFQVRYGVDRVETTSAVWLGLTMGCAVCHDHKFDPITQKEFYQVFSIFNNISEKAMDGNALLPPPMMKAPEPGAGKAAQGFGRPIGGAGQRRAALRWPALNYTDPATLTNAPKPEPKEIVWIDDDFPKGAAPQVNEGNPPNKWVSTNEGPVLSGQRAIQRSGKGLHQVFFPDCAEPLTVSAGDKLFAYVFLDPKDPPKAIMLQYSVAGNWSKRANWGDEDAIPYGAKGTPEKLLLGKLPKAGRWVRLEVEAARLELKPGDKDHRHGVHDVRWHGLLGQSRRSGHHRSRARIRRFRSSRGQSRRRASEASQAPDDVKAALKKEPAKRDAAEQQRLREYFLANVYAEAGPELLALRDDVPAHPRKARGAGQGNPGDDGLAGAGKAASGLAAHPRPIRQARRAGVPGRAGRAAAVAAKRRDEPAHVREVAGGCEESADGARHGEPVLAAVLRHGPGEDQRGFRHAERVALASRIAGLAGDRIHPHRLGREGLREDDCHLRDLSAGLAGNADSCWHWTRRTGCSRAGRNIAWTRRCCGTTPCA